MKPHKCTALGEAIAKRNKWRFGTLVYDRPGTNKSTVLSYTLRFADAEDKLHVVTLRSDEVSEFITREKLTPLQIPDDYAFKLHDTYGFPIDLTRIMAEERGMTVDIAGYEKLMEEAREKARNAGKGGDSQVLRSSAGDARGACQKRRAENG